MTTTTGWLPPYRAPLRWRMWWRARAMARPALYWFAVAVWFDLSDRLISGPLDQLFSHWHETLWLVGVTACAQ